MSHDSLGVSPVHSFYLPLDFRPATWRTLHSSVCGSGALGRDLLLARQPPEQYLTTVQFFSKAFRFTKIR